MKKNTLLSVLIIPAIIACTIFISDGLIYLITSLMALAIMGTIHSNRSGVLKITRWAKANPQKAQVLITGLQIALMALGIFAGNNFKEMGYEFSGTTAYVFCAISITGFLSIPFLPKRSTIALPVVVNRHRLAYMGIALSSFVMMVLFGNRIADNYPNSPITSAVKAIDKVILPDNSTQADPDDAALEPVGQALTDGTAGMAAFASFAIYGKEKITPSIDLKKDARAKMKAEKKAHRLEKKKARMANRLEKYRRLLLAGGSTALAVLLIILLLVPLCAGICLIIGAFGDATAGSVVLGLILTGGSVWGIIAASKMSKRKNKTGP